MSKFDPVVVPLPAGQETNLLGADGIDVAPFDRLGLEVYNAGDTNSIDTVTVYYRVGIKWIPFATNYAGSGIVPDDASLVILVDQFAGGRIRVTATSASGTDARIEGEGVPRR